MKVSELRRALKGTGAQILEVKEPRAVVHRHAFRLASHNEIIALMAREMGRILGSDGIPMHTDEPDHITLVFGRESFATLSDLKIRYFRKKIIACSTPDLGKHKVTRAVVFGEHEHWGPRKIWEEKSALEFLKSLY